MELYLALKVLWWLLLGVLLMGLAIMVGSRPYTVQGWRPTSAVTQPISQAIQGTGIIHGARRRNQRLCCTWLRRV